MGTFHFAGLYYENPCWKCNGEKTYGGEKCKICNGNGMLWRRWHYTHSRTYGDALEKLLPRLSQWASFPSDGRWLLVWKDRYTKKIMEVIDVTPAVKYRINEIMERRRKKLLRDEKKNV